MAQDEDSIKNIHTEWIGISQNIKNVNIKNLKYIQNGEDQPEP